MPLSLPGLPFAINALEPHISARTLEFHHGKHHSAYVTNGNKLIAGTEWELMEPEAIIVKAAKDPSASAIFNNAAQAWNHAFYWNCITPNGGGAPSGAIAARIIHDFGSYEKFLDEFKNAGATQFGSGWAWLVLDGPKLRVVKTPNAGNPLTLGMTPLLTVDVWEHAYYLDYQNRRQDYLSMFVEKLVNWEFANSQLG
jgi:Fe-Mn family superoxide dismutase